MCLFTSQESTLLSPQCSLKLHGYFISSSNCVCMHVFVCRLFVQGLATETFSSLRSKLHSGYRLSRQPQSLSGTGSIFTLTCTVTHTHTDWGEPLILWRMRLFLAHLGTKLLWEDPTARLKETHGLLRSVSKIQMTLLLVHISEDAFLIC